MYELEPEDALELINKHNQNPDFELLDIRRERDFKRNWIKGSVNLPYFDDDFDYKLKKKNKDKIYLIYCSGDAASNITIETMAELGFKNISKISGGISKWYKQGLEIASSIKA